ncbi:hypothetical protein FK178_02725 [Antarcticibacterium arcticum]|uniref:Uncharacterized protein n=1 Tax=Antarcticibacterium arcticum TaxID=2585771 RepID=A0A5B8YJ86_9FLAO|nr:hypothetical protein [Antarcticibacterium arcticum]QED36693.1 hypothetical protein FK178_02725 [Antarcticibacterium arcticum]
MSTSTSHPIKAIYRREIQEAFELLESLKKDGFYNVPKITWWILKYEELNEYSWNHRHVGSCIDGMGCCCTDKNPESKFSFLYSALEEVVDLYQHEKYFKEELSVLEKLKDDHPALMQWLKKNEKLGSEEFLLFWIEWLEEEHTVVPFLFGLNDLGIKFRSEDWKNTIEFCEVFNEIYRTSDVCPKHKDK